MCTFLRVYVPLRNSRVYLSSVCISLRVCVPPCISLRAYVALYMYLPGIRPSVCTEYVFSYVSLGMYASSGVRPSVYMSLRVYVRLYVLLCTSCVYVPPCYVRIPYVSLCVYLCVSTSLRVYILSWIYPPCVSLYVCPFVYMSLCMYSSRYVPLYVSCFVCPSVTMLLPCESSEIPFTYLPGGYFSECISLFVYVPPCVCLSI